MVIIGMTMIFKRIRVTSSHLFNLNFSTDFNRHTKKYSKNEYCNTLFINDLMVVVAFFQNLLIVSLRSNKEEKTRGKEEEEEEGKDKTRVASQPAKFSVSKCGKGRRRNRREQPRRTAKNSHEDFFLHGVCMEFESSFNSCCAFNTCGRQKFLLQSPLSIFEKYSLRRRGWSSLQGKREGIPLCPARDFSDFDESTSLSKTKSSSSSTTSFLCS